MFLLRGIEFTYETVLDWEAKLAPLLIDDHRRRRGGGSRVRRSWYVDETYIKVHGRWCYLYRAIDRAGGLVDVMLSQSRDMAAVEKFFGSAKAVTGVTPARVTTDGHDSYPRAIRSQLGENVQHQNRQCLNNRIEQDHRGIKSRYAPMRGFGAVSSAARFCRCHDELRNLLHTTSRFCQTLPAAARRFLRASRIALRVMAS
jgi:putative transposase